MLGNGGAACRRSFAEPRGAARGAVSMNVTHAVTVLHAAVALCGAPSALCRLLRVAEPPSAPLFQPACSYMSGRAILGAQSARDGRTTGAKPQNVT